VISCWVRGLSDRDVEAMLVEVFGEQATISRTTASRISREPPAPRGCWGPSPGPAMNLSSEVDSAVTIRVMPSLPFLVARAGPIAGAAN
jgi:hypothetical protein